MTIPTTPLDELFERWPAPWHANPCATCHSLGGRLDGRDFNVSDANGTLVLSDLPELLALLVAAAPGLAGAASELLDMAEAWCIDWARLSSSSDDYDPSYKPDFPAPVTEMSAALGALARRAEEEGMGQ